jgi:hypothetical protein
VIVGKAMCLGKLDAQGVEASGKKETDSIDRERNRF